MKRTIFIILICFVSCIEDQIFQYENVYRKETKSLSAEQMYYWAGGRKIYLSVVPNKYFVVLDESAVHRISKSLPSINSNEKMSRINYKEDDNGECYYTLIDSATMDAYGDAVLYSAPYLLNNQCEVGLTNIFYVALKS